MYRGTSFIRMSIRMITSFQREDPNEVCTLLKRTIDSGILRTRPNAPLHMRKKGWSLKCGTTRL